MVDHFSKSDKDYGLPEVELVPIDRDQPGVASPPPAPPVATKTEKDNRWVPILLLIAIGLILTSAVFYFFFLDTPNANTGDDRLTETTTNDRVTLEDSEQTDADANSTGDQPSEATSGETAADNQVVDDNIANQEPGTIQTISDRTGRYYIFLGSYKFKAYAQRHADRLAADGYAVKIITPDNWVGMRVAVGNYASVAEASADVSQIEAKYGNQVVVSKY